MSLKYVPETQLMIGVSSALIIIIIIMTKVYATDQQLLHSMSSTFSLQFTTDE